MTRSKNIPDLNSAGVGQYTKGIIRCLEKVTGCSGHGPHVVFTHWTQLVEATLEALPTHATSIAQTGRWAEDTPETAKLLADIRAQYSHYGHLDRVWGYFGEAFALLLEAAAPGLWAFDFDDGYMGPDVLGHVFMLYTSPSEHLGQYMSPWPVALTMAHIVNIGGKEQVYARLKQACTHPDNILAHAVLLAGLMIQEPAQAREWFITRVVPAAMPYYQPVTVCDPCVGSGVMLLASAATYEPWMVQMGLVQFYAQDIDMAMVRLVKINCALYGLNSYGLKLAAALAELSRAKVPAQLPTSPWQTYKTAQQHGRQVPETAPIILPSFEELFRRQVEPAAEEELALA